MPLLKQIACCLNKCLQALRGKKTINLKGACAVWDGAHCLMLRTQQNSHPYIVRMRYARCSATAKLDQCHDFTCCVQDIHARESTLVCEEKKPPQTNALLRRDLGSQDVTIKHVSHFSFLMSFAISFFSP